MHHHGLRTPATTAAARPRGTHRVRRRPALVGTAVLVGGLGIAACSSGSGTSSTTAAPSTGTVAARSVPGVGTVLVDSSGRTLYLLSADHQKTATCLSSTACVAAWPPLVLPAGTAKPSAGTGIDASLLSTLTGPDGRTQVTYNGWPLYTFAGDTGAGQARGEGIQSFGGVWSAVGTSGQAVTGSGTSGSTATTGTTSGGSSGGY